MLGRRERKREEIRLRDEGVLLGVWLPAFSTGSDLAFLTFRSLVFFLEVLALSGDERELETS